MSSYQLYAFTDASTKGYGAVIYICRNQETSLVMSKSRVAPIKAITLPKLELMAAVTATRLMQLSYLHLIFNPLISSTMYTCGPIVKMSCIGRTSNTTPSRLFLTV